jgi:hypothetical protein
MQHGASLVRRLTHAGWPKGVLLNINFPDCEPEAVKGSAATVQGQRDPDMLRVDDRIDTRGRAYYWLGIQRRNSKSPKGTDIWAVRSNLISVTPLRLDLTDQQVAASLEPVLDVQRARVANSEAPPTSKVELSQSPLLEAGHLICDAKAGRLEYEFLRHSARNTRPHCGLNRVCPTQIAIA